MLKQLARAHTISRTLLQYGIDQLLPQQHRPWPVRVLRGLLFFWRNRHRQLNDAERLRLALEALGPVFIKFGQMLSTRRDLLPERYARELGKLQDKVAPFSGTLAKQRIEQALEQPLETLFDQFELEALATASIAQVHTAVLKHGEDAGAAVVLKVLRPGVAEQIQADLQLMASMARWLERLLPESRRLRPQAVVEEYRKTILDELDLRIESANAMQLRRNFEGSTTLYVPKVYTDYCRTNLMVMERIYGIPVGDVDALKASGVDMKLLAERGVEVFFTQVFRDSFFHADMHPGNIFVDCSNPLDPTWIGIDCGIVGTLNRDDKRYLAENFLAFFNRDYRRVAELHVDSGWVPPDTNVDAFEAAIRTVCEPIFNKPLAEISFGHVLIHLFATARRFQMEVQPQLVLLQKTLLYIEGLGRQLYPQLDLWQTAKPFLESWMDDQLGGAAIRRHLKENLPYWGEKLPEMPQLIYQALHQGRLLGHHIEQMTQQQINAQRRVARSYFMLTLSLLFAAGAASSYFLQQLPLAALLTFASTLSWWTGWRINAPRQES